MKKVKSVLTIALVALLFVGCNKDDDSAIRTYEEKVVVANRSGGSISFIDATTNQVTKTLSISGSEPMYVVYVASKDKLYVGDRAGKKVHIVNPQSQVVENSIPVGNGVFHMWADGLGKQLWVNNDIDNSISVIDLNTNTVIQTIAVGMKPHDVFITKDATKAFVSVIDSNPANPDKIYSYSTTTYLKTGEVSVGKDPHLFHLSNSNKLFVPCQSGNVYTINASDLSITFNNVFAGAHGIFPSPDQNNVFLTNISGGQIYSINASTGITNGTALASLSTTPHNIVLNGAGNKMFVTHSGATATTVSTYAVNAGTLTAGTTLNTGLNPFGLTYYLREVK
jgi:YVTN family beta-propeller protein